MPQRLPFLLAGLFACAVAQAEFHVDDTGQALNIAENGAPVLSYHYGWVGEVLILPLTRRRASSYTLARTRPIGWTLRSIAGQEFSGRLLWTSAFRSGTSAA